MENKYGMEIEYDVEIPESRTGRMSGGSIYREIINDFINSQHEVMRIKCGDTKVANSKRTSLKKMINPKDSIMVMVRRSDVYVVKTGLEMEEN